MEIFSSKFALLRRVTLLSDNLSDLKKKIDEIERLSN